MAVDLPDPQARTKPNDKRVAKSSYAAALVGAGTGHGATLVAENDDIDLRDDDAMTGLAVHLTPLPESPLDAPNAQNIVATEKASERLLQDDVTKSGNVCQQQGLGRKGNVVQRTRNTRVVIVDDRDVNRLTIPRRDGKEPCPSKKGNGKTDVPKISSLKGHSNASAGARITATFRRLLGLIQMLQGAVWHPFWRQTL
ncbi:hypothetical protein V6N13_124443 [Hibiscus sabdariffa]